MKYYYDFTVPYQDVDMDRRLRLYTLENYLLGYAAQTADRIGFGIPQLLPYNYTWIITNLNAELDYLPTHNDTIQIETWIESNHHSLSTRNYRLYLTNNGEHKLIGKVKSVWAVLELTRREIVNPFNMPMFEGCEDGEVLEINRCARIRGINEPTTTGEHTVVYSDMDYNRHCNSCKYLEMMLNTRFPEFIRQAREKGEQTGVKLEITYSKEAQLAETLKILCAETENDTCYQETNSEGLTCCTCRISKL